MPLKGVPLDYGGLPSINSSLVCCSEEWRGVPGKAEKAVDLELVRGEGSPHGWAAEGRTIASVPKDTRSLLARGVYKRPSVNLYDARARLGERSCLADHGIALLPHKSALSDWGDNDIIKRVYYPETANLIKELTGADQCHVLDQKKRGVESQTWGDKDYSDQVHSDLTAGFEWTNGHRGQEPWRLVDGHHFAVYNLWRPVDPWPLRNDHLALLDPATVEPEDIVLYEHHSSADKVDVLRLAHSERHKWIYFPRQTSAEAMIFLQYDSREPNLPLRQIYHASITDPTCPKDYPPRRSIDLRVLCIFGKDTDPERRARYTAQYPPSSQEWLRLDLPYHYQHRARQLSRL